MTNHVGFLCWQKDRLQSEVNLLRRFGDRSVEYKLAELERKLNALKSQLRNILRGND